jgi:DNA invertase Pin-like site-specific DNA recombinase
MAEVANSGRKTESVGVVGYCRVKPGEPTHSGHSLKDQEKAIRTVCESRGYQLLALYSDAGAPEYQGRPALSSALASLSEGNGSILMVTKLDRLTRSMHVAARVMASAERGGWSIVALDSAVDTTTTPGGALVEVLALFDEMERKLIGEQEARPGLSIRRPAPKLGRPSTLSAEVVERIVHARKGGATWAAIADNLNEEAVPTAQGGKQWYPATVRHVANAAESRH